MFRPWSSFLPFTRSSVSEASAETKQEGIGKTERSDELPAQHLNITSDIEEQLSSLPDDDAFGNENGTDLQYKTCAWW